jgi:CRP/FNR family nitrogen fixation transcriptional regulator
MLHVDPVLLRREAEPTQPFYEPAEGSGLAFSLVPMGACMPFARNAEIYAEDEPAEYLYVVAKGAVRSYKLLSDGRRQIEAFYLPGDLFGIEAGEKHRFSAEAISGSTIWVVKRSVVDRIARRDSAVSRELWMLAAQHLERAQDHLLLLARHKAHERMAAFLLEMAKRSGSAAQGEIELPMPRQDIADYLGLTIETVSRTLSEMVNAGTISLRSTRRILLRDRAALERLNA